MFDFFFHITRLQNQEVQADDEQTIRKLSILLLCLDGMFVLRAIKLLLRLQELHQQNGRN